MDYRRVQADGSGLGSRLSVPPALLPFQQCLTYAESPRIIPKAWLGVPQAACVEA